MWHAAVMHGDLVALYKPVQWATARLRTASADVCTAHNSSGKQLGQIIPILLWGHLG